MDGKVPKGRKPLGPQLVDRLDGSHRAKQRLEVILETIAGKRTIPEACEALGIGEAMFHRLRIGVLQAGLAELEPRPLGRPPHMPIGVSSTDALRRGELERQLEEMNVELKATQVRLELAQAMPQLVAQATLKKNDTAETTNQGDPMETENTRWEEAPRDLSGNEAHRVNEQTMQPDGTQDNLSRLAGASRRRRLAHEQRKRRLHEHSARRCAAAFCSALGKEGYSCRDVAKRLEMRARTLANWTCHTGDPTVEVPLRGRPCCESSFEERYAVLEVLQHLGPHVGLPTLRGLFPEMPRCELIELQAAYRQEYQSQHRASVEQLAWTTPGRVWAMDHYEPLHAVDGCYEAVLAVRDLASGMQLAWLPVPDQTAASTCLVLATLFTEHAPPLVLKSDNGSAFKSQELHELLDACSVVPLFSPPRLPRYNGSCEAGIGSMQTRTVFLAAISGRPLHWTSDDLEAARRQANELHRPAGYQAPTPQQSWHRRTLICDPERGQLSKCLRHHQDQIIANCSPQQPMSKTMIHRRAVRRALVELGLLTITRRSITLPIKSRKLANIP